MCVLKSKMFLVLLVLLVLVPLQVFAWPKAKTEVPQIQQVPTVTEQEPMQSPMPQLEKEVVVVEVPSPATGFTEKDKNYLMNLTQELKKSLETTTKKEFELQRQDLALLIQELEQLRTSSEIKDAGHEELVEAYTAKEAEYNALADAYAKTQRGKFMLGATTSMDVTDFTFGAGLELGYAGKNYYLTLGLDKDFYSVEKGFTSWEDGYKVTAKAGLLF